MTYKNIRGNFFIKIVSALVSIAFLLTSIDINLLLAQSQDTSSYIQKLSAPSIWKPLAKEGYAISEQLQFELLLGTRLLYKNREKNKKEILEDVNAVLSDIFNAKKKPPEFGAIKFEDFNFEKLSDNRIRLTALFKFTNKPKEIFQITYTDTKSIPDKIEAKAQYEDIFVDSDEYKIERVDGRTGAITLRPPKDGDLEIWSPKYQQILQDIRKSKIEPLDDNRAKPIGKIIRNRTPLGFMTHSTAGKEKAELIQKIGSAIAGDITIESLGLTVQATPYRGSKVHDIKIMLVDLGDATYFGESPQDGSYELTDYDLSTKTLNVYLTKKYVDAYYREKERPITQTVLHALLESVLGFNHQEAVLLLSAYNCDYRIGQDLNDAHMVILREIRKRAEAGDAGAIKYLVSLVEKGVPAFPEESITNLRQLGRTEDWISEIGSLYKKTAESVHKFILPTVGNINGYVYVKREDLGNGFSINRLDSKYLNSSQLAELDSFFKAVLPSERRYYSIIAIDGRPFAFALSDEQHYFLWTTPFMSLKEEDLNERMLYHAGIMEVLRLQTQKSGRLVEWADLARPDHLQAWLEADADAYRPSGQNPNRLEARFENAHFNGKRIILGRSYPADRQTFQLRYTMKGEPESARQTVMTRKHIRDAYGSYRLSYLVMPQKVTAHLATGLIGLQVLQWAQKLGLTTVGSNLTPSRNARSSYDTGADFYLLEKERGNSFKEAGINVIGDLGGLLNTQGSVDLIIEAMDSKKPIRMPVVDDEGNVLLDGNQKPREEEMSPSEFWRRRLLKEVAARGIPVNYQGGSDVMDVDWVNTVLLEMTGLPFDASHINDRENMLFSCNGTSTLGMLSPLGSIMNTIDSIEVDVHFIRRKVDFPQFIASEEKPKPLKRHHTDEDILHYLEQLKGKLPPELQGKVNFKFAEKPFEDEMETAFVTMETTGAQNLYHKVIATFRVKKSDGNYMTAAEYRPILHKAPNLAIMNLPGTIEVEEEEGKLKGANLKQDSVNEMLQYIFEELGFHRPAITPVVVEDLKDKTGFVVGGLTFQRHNVVPINLAVALLRLGLIAPGDVPEANRRAIEIMGMDRLKEAIERGPYGDPEIKKALASVQKIDRPIREKSYNKLDELLGKITELPELEDKLEDSPKEKIARLKELVLKTNEDEYYYKRGEAPLAVQLKGEFGKLLGLRDNDLPLYYTIAISQKADADDIYTSAGNIYISKQATDLARDMKFKGPLSGVLFDGCKTYIYFDGKNYIAVTAVYGDKELFDKGYVIAKGGMRGKEREGSKTTKEDIWNAVKGAVKASIDLGTAGVTSLYGPDMSPRPSIDVQDIMELIDKIGIQAEKDLNKELLPLTTGGHPEKGYISHADWRITSFYLLECIAALLKDKDLLANLRLSQEEPKTIIIEGFGEVGSNIVRVLWEQKEKYREYNFKIVAISDKEFGAFYNKEGFSLEELYKFAEALADARKRGARINIDDYKFLSEYKLSTLDEVIFMPATILIPAAQAYVIQDEAAASKLKVKIIAPAANTIFGKKDSSVDDVKRLEEFIAKVLGIFSYPAWLGNPGGYIGSKEEFLHRFIEGGLAEMARPERRKWLKDHVMGGDISDVAWVNTFWALYLWKKAGYEGPISEIMKEKVDRILAKRKELILQADKTNKPRTTREKLELLDTATIVAKSQVLIEDLGRDLNSLRIILGEKNTPLEERRIAAYILGGTADKNYIDDLLKILQDDKEPGIIYRNAAVSLGYILEMQKEDDRREGLKKTIPPLQDIWKRLSQLGQGALGDDNYQRKIWIEWILRKFKFMVIEDGKETLIKLAAGGGDRGSAKNIINLQKALAENFEKGKFDYNYNLYKKHGVAPEPFRLIFIKALEEFIDNNVKPGSRKYEIATRELRFAKGFSSEGQGGMMPRDEVQKFVINKKIKDWADKMFKLGHVLSIDLPTVADLEDGFLASIIENRIVYSATTNNNGNFQLLKEMQARAKAKGEADPLEEEIKNIVKEKPELLKAENKTKLAWMAYENLINRFVARLAVAFLPIYKETNYRHGFVSTELPTEVVMAEDTPANVDRIIKAGIGRFEATQREIEKLISFKTRNLLLKIPATPVGLKAGEQLEVLGYNVNYTLVATEEQYRATVKAHKAGGRRFIENYLEKNWVHPPLEEIPQSVSSDFVSRDDRNLAPILEDETFRKLIEHLSAVRDELIKDNIKSRAVRINPLIITYNQLIDKYTHLQSSTAEVDKEEQEKNIQELRFLRGEGPKNTTRAAIAFAQANIGNIWKEEFERDAEWGKFLYEVRMWLPHDHLSQQIYWASTGVKVNNVYTTNPFYLANVILRHSTDTVPRAVVEAIAKSEEEPFEPREISPEDVKASNEVLQRLKILGIDLGYIKERIIFPAGLDEFKGSDTGSIDLIGEAIEKVRQDNIKSETQIGEETIKLAKERLESKELPYTDEEAKLLTKEEIGTLDRSKGIYNNPRKPEWKDRALSNAVVIYKKLREAMSDTHAQPSSVTEVFVTDKRHQPEKTEVRMDGVITTTKTETMTILTKDNADKFIDIMRTKLENVESELIQKNVWIIMKGKFELEYPGNDTATEKYKRMIQGLHTIEGNGGNVTFVKDKISMINVMKRKILDDYKVVVIDDNPEESLTDEDLSGLEGFKKQYAVIQAEVRRQLEADEFQYFNIKAMVALGLAMMGEVKDEGRIKEFYNLLTGEDITDDKLEDIKASNIIRLLPRIVKFSGELDTYTIIRKLVDIAA